jgi:aryl-alcohol dehydrogenase
MKIKAALPSLLGKYFEIETLELREPGPEEVLVKLVASGVCHTDITMMTGHMMVLGHEGSGIVEAVGPIPAT